MSKSLESKELQAAAEATFKQYPKENVIYVASNGNVFLKAQKGDAFNHATQNELTVTRVDRPNTALQNIITEVKEGLTAESGKASGDSDQDTDFRGQSIDLNKASATDIVNAILSETTIHAQNKALAPDDSESDNQTSTGEVQGTQEETTETPQAGDQESGQATDQAGAQLTLEPVAPVTETPVVDPVKPVEAAKATSTKKKSFTTKTAVE